MEWIIMCRGRKIKKKRLHGRDILQKSRVKKKIFRLWLQVEEVCRIFIMLSCNVGLL